MAAAGVSGMLFGLLYGAAFGHQIMRAAWLQPLEGIWTILITAVAGGVVLLNIGFAMNLVNAWRSKDWPRLFLEKNGVVGIALYWTLLGGGLGVGFGILPKSRVAADSRALRVALDSRAARQLDLAPALRSALARRWSLASLNSSKR